MTLNDHDIHVIRITIKFGIDTYEYHVHLDMFQTFDPKMTFLISEWPFMTPKMTSNDFDMHIIRLRRKFWIDPYVYRVHLDVFQIFDPKTTFLISEWPFATPKMNSNDLNMRRTRISFKFGIDPYAYHAYSI